MNNATSRVTMSDVLSVMRTTRPTPQLREAQALARSQGLLYWPYEPGIHFGLSAALVATVKEVGNE